MAKKEWLPVLRMNGSVDMVVLEQADSINPTLVKRLAPDVSNLPSDARTWPTQWEAFVYGLRALSDISSSVFRGGVEDATIKIISVEVIDRQVTRSVSSG